MKPLFVNILQLLIIFLPDFAISSPSTRRTACMISLTNAEAIEKKSTEIGAFAMQIKQKALSQLKLGLENEDKDRTQLATTSADCGNDRQRR